MIRNKPLLKGIALFFAAELVVQAFFPTAAMALTSGPVSPDFASFEPVATTDMVDLFTGDFTYNLPVLSIPGPEGAGYSMSMSYHSGVNSEQEASWVGLGWSLNPGVINRQTNGYPDDFRNAQVKQYNKVRPNWTVSAGKSIGLEVYSDSRDKPEGPKKPAPGDTQGLGEQTGSNLSTAQGAGAPTGTAIMSTQDISDTDTENAEILSKGSFRPSLSLTSGLRFNNYNGFLRSFNVGLGFDFRGITGGINLNRSGSFAQNGGESTLAAQVGLSGAWFAQKSKPRKQLRNVKNYRQLKRRRNRQRMLRRAIASNAHATTASKYNMLAFEGSVYSVSQPRYMGITTSSKPTFQVNVAPAHAGIELGIEPVSNVKVNVPELAMDAYGYMYNPDLDEMEDQSHQETATDDSGHSRVLSDFTMEKNTPFSRRKVFTGIPFSNADQFVVTGEGIGGGFRQYQLQPGHYYPNASNNITASLSRGFEVAVGPDLQLGASVGGTISTQRTKSWSRAGDTGDLQFQPTTSDRLYRFSNDMGGELDYSPTAAQTADLAPAGAFQFKGFKNFEANLQDHTTSNDPLPVTPIGAASDIGRSSFIESVTAGEATSGNYLDQSADIVNMVSGFAGAAPEAVLQMATTNASGQRYVYGLPSAARNEQRLQFAPTEQAVNRSNPQQGIPNVLRFDPTIDTKELLNNTEVLGEVRDQDYAASYLLTQITTPYYVDIDNNGPSADDFGAWVKFRYRKAYDFYAPAPNDAGYLHRTPYTGFFHEKNSVGSAKDDRLSVVKGEREVAYLKYIETKTHLALFVTNKTTDVTFQGVLSQGQRHDLAKWITGSGVPRKDGLAAHPLNAKDGSAGTDQLEHLERIVLISKRNASKPLQVTNFEYAYELVPGTPNSGTSTQGKLTLKRLWFEYEGISRSRIAPYTFHYEYARTQDYAPEVAAQYSEIVGFADNLQSAAENPSFYYGLDPWGYHRENGEERAGTLRPWVDQQPSTSWDPAAWHLKRIELPSGGEIQIQYEQEDYSHVQNRVPLAMVPLKNVSGHLNSYNSDNKYYLDDSALNIDANDPNYATVLQALQQKVVRFFGLDPATGLAKSSTAPRFMHFKFLYALTGQIAQTPEAAIEQCNADYISGYAPVRECGVDAEGVFVRFGPTQEEENAANAIGQLDPELRYKWDHIPRKACYNYMLYNRGGMTEGDCEPYLEAEYDGQIQNQFTNVENEEDLLVAMLDPTFVASMEAAAWDLAAPMVGGEFDVSSKYRTPKPLEACVELNYALSYLRVPVYHAKKGGGLRVKRLLMYDPGLETGGSMLYGASYRYENEDGTSSGVATTEPAGIREENVLVDLISGKIQSAYSKLKDGTIDADLEGPIGESLLPSPSIGHARVVVENIHRGTTANGFAVHDYNTVRDLPFDYTFGDGPARDFSGKAVSYTDLKDNTESDQLAFSYGIFGYRAKRAWATQGFRFALHNFHGTPRQMATYPGSYDPNIKAQVPVTYKKYHYYQPGEKVPVIDGYDPANALATWHLASPGKDMDIAIEMNSVEELTASVGIELDIGFNSPFLAPEVSVVPRLQVRETELNTHANTKVIRYPIILKQVETKVDGATSTLENLAFNKSTGQPVLTKTTDAYHAVEIDGAPHAGEVYAFSVPGSWIYDGLGQRSESNNNSNQLNVSVGNVVIYANNPMTGTGASGTVDLGQAAVNSHILAASAVKMKNEWFMDGEHPSLEAEYFANGLSTDEREALNAQYHVESNYVYHTNRTTAGSASKGIADAGFFTDFTPFDWTADDATLEANKWIKGSEVVLYSPNAQPLQEVDALDIPSTVKFGYSQQLPVLVAANATYDNVFFEDFENSDVTASRPAHSGSYSHYMSTGGSTKSYALPTVNVDSQLIDEGGIVRVWLHGQYGSLNAPAPDKENMNHNFRVSSGAQAQPMVRVARTGEWDLYEAYLDLSGYSENDALQLSLEYNAESDESVYIDDVRFQPRESQMTCYVYDPDNYRLLTEFGDQHFGVYYQYDLEGKLVRQLIETERGMKTLKETQYNVPRQNRSN